MAEVLSTYIPPLRAPSLLDPESVPSKNYQLNEPTYSFSLKLTNPVAACEIDRFNNSLWTCLPQTIPVEEKSFAPPEIPPSTEIPVTTTTVKPAVPAQPPTFYGFKVITTPDGRRFMGELDEAGDVIGVATLRGFNISGFAKESGLPCSLENADDCAQTLSPLFERLAQDGYNLIRLPLVWENLEKGQGMIDHDKAKILRDVVNEAAKYGLYVLIDFHQDLLGKVFRRSDNDGWHGNGFPQWFLERAYKAGGGTGKFDPQSWWGTGDLPWGINYKLNKQLRTCMRGLGDPEIQKLIKYFFKQIGEEFKDCPNIFSYDVLNEPYSPELNGEAYIAYAKAAREGLYEAGALADSAKRSVFRGLFTAIGAIPTGEMTPTASLDPGGDWAFSDDTFPRVATNNTGHQTFDGLRASKEGFSILAGHLYDPRALMTYTDPESKKIEMPDLQLSSTIRPKEDITIGPAELQDPKFASTVIRYVYDFFPPEPDRYEESVKLAVARAKSMNMVFIVGEWGIPNNVHDFSREELQKTMLTSLERYQASSLGWQLQPRSCDAPDDGFMGENLSKICIDESGEIDFKTLGYEELLRPIFQRTGGPLEKYEYLSNPSWRLNARIGQTYEAGWTTKLFIPETLGDCIVTLNGEDFLISGTDRHITFDTDNGPINVAIAPIDNLAAPKPPKPIVHYKPGDKRFFATASRTLDQSTALQFLWNPTSSNGRNLSFGYAGVIDYRVPDNNFKISALADLSFHHNSLISNWGLASFQFLPSVHFMTGMGFDFNNQSTFISSRIMAQLASVGPSTFDWSLTLGALAQFQNFTPSVGVALTFGWGGIPSLRTEPSLK